MWCECVFIHVIHKQRIIFKVIYSLNFCSLHIVHCNCDCASGFDLFFYEAVCLLLSFQLKRCVMLHAHCSLSIEKERKIRKMKEKKNRIKESLTYTLIGGRYTLIAKHDKIRSNQYHDVALEVDWRFMEWSWRCYCLLLNDLWQIFRCKSLFHWKILTREKRNLIADEHRIQNTYFIFI